jgi:hypothetical protein
VGDRRELLREIDAIWDDVETLERRYGAIPHIAADLAEIRRRLHALAQESRLPWMGETPRVVLH